MRISSDLFNAFLKCSTKCWLRASGEPAADGAYAEWLKSRNRSYHATEIERLLSEPKNEVAVSPPLENLKAAQWHLAANLSVRAQMKTGVLESEVHAVERVPSESRGGPRSSSPFATSSRINSPMTTGCCWPLIPWYSRKRWDGMSPLARSFTATTTPSEGKNLRPWRAKCGSAWKRSPRCSPTLRRPSLF